VRDDDSDESHLHSTRPGYRKIPGLVALGPGDVSHTARMKTMTIRQPSMLDYLPPRTRAVLMAHPKLVPRCHSDLPMGWDEPVAALLLQFVELQAQATALGMTLKVEQFKEKFGGLRVYRSFQLLDGRTAFEHEQMAEMDADELHQYRCDHAPDGPETLELRQSVRTLIEDVEQQVATMCGNCGQPGQMIKSGWMRVRCEACRNPS